MLRRTKRLVALLGVLTLTVGGNARCKSKPTAPAAASVQIVSVKVDPPIIHKALPPNRARVIVVLRCDGHVPRGARVRVVVGDYASDPPGNHAVYTRSTWDGPPRKGKTVVTLQMRGGPGTKTGSLIVAATITGYDFPEDPAIKKPATVSGLSIKSPLAPANWQAMVNTVAP